MKILLATDGYTHTTNGVANVVIALADKYRAEGHSVKVLTLSDSRKSYQKGEDYFISSFSILIYPDTRQSVVRRHPFLKEIIEWRPDIIHIHTEGSVAGMSRYISKKTDAPIVMTMHTDWAKFAFHDHSEAAFVKFLGSLGSKLVYRDARLMTVPSPKAQDLLKGYLPKRRVVVIPNGIKLERFQQPLTQEERAELLAQYGLKDNGKLLVIVSRISAEKRLDEILEFFPRLRQADPEVQLLIAGDGPDKKNLEHLAEKLGITDSVIFAGMVPPEKVYRIYKLGTAFLSASTFEMHSLTYLEAIACGIPLICRNDPCLRGVLDDGVNGFTYETQDEFTKKVLKVIQNPALRQQMSDAALQKSLEFSDTACAHRMIEMYGEVIEEAAKEREEEEKAAKEAEKAAKEAEKAEKKAEKEAEKAEKAEKKAEKEAGKAEKKAAKEAEKAEKKAEKEAEKAEKKEKKDK